CLLLRCSRTPRMLTFLLFCVVSPPIREPLSFPTRRSSDLHRFQFLLQLTNSLMNQSTIYFQLFLTRPSCTNPTAETGKGIAKSNQTSCTVPQLRKFYLNFS